MELKAGDKIAITFEDASGEVEHAVICRSLTDEEEGLGPEIEDYVASWLEISEDNCMDLTRRRTISFGTDYQYSLDGRRITISKL